MTSAKDCLIEIGLEELPPLAMPALSSAFVAGIEAGLKEARLTHGRVEPFAAPRRLAILIRDLSDQQPDETEELRGPPVRVAFDDDGAPTRAALAFADKAGTNVESLQRLATDKGEWLVYEAHREGRPTHELMSGIVHSALDALPIPRRMRWGDSDEAFVRPVHWVVALHGNDVLPLSVYGIEGGAQSQGHRFHHHGPVDISEPAAYVDALRAARVVVDFEARAEQVWAAATAAAESIGGKLDADEGLVQEIAALCDWPVAVLGRFDERFLALPFEVLESTLKKHQRYFPVVDANGKPMSAFVTISNIESRQPEEVQRGNERVVAPRLADAEFFWRNDTRQTLASRRERLDSIVYQKALGSIGDKVRRVTALARSIAESLAMDATNVERASELSRCDLVTDMVNEFPDLQGVMGGYYAREDGEHDDVVAAIREQYWPRFAGDAIPSERTGQVIAIADRLDTLAGIFAIGKRPTGSRDPFALRRAAVGLVRILIEGELDLDLTALLDRAIDGLPVEVESPAALRQSLYDFVIERLRHYYDREVGIARADLFESVAQRVPRSVLDFDQRLRGVASFVELSAASALAAANKRIVNLLRNASMDDSGSVDRKLAIEPAEIALMDKLEEVQARAAPQLSARDYTSALSSMSALQPEVDQFFDDVMVMADDEAVRRNRLALLADVRALFLKAADVSELQAAGGQ